MGFSYKIWKFIALVFLALLIYGFISIKQLSPAEIEYPNQDPRVARVESFFQKYNSPFKKYATDFIEIADRYRLDWKILPVVAMVESSGGKFYTGNAFGWGNGSIDFGSDVDDINGIAKGLATLSYYEKYRQTPSLATFARCYNAPSETYLEQLTYFYERL